MVFKFSYPAELVWDVCVCGYDCRNTYYPMFGFGHARVKSSVCLFVYVFLSLHIHHAVIVV